MKEIRFKTSINCGNCVRAVTGFVEEVEGLEEWNVDTGHADKILTVKGATVDEKAVIEAVEDAGFEIQPLP
jgi:copper chaperone CopZ